VRFLDANTTRWAGVSEELVGRSPPTARPATSAPGSALEKGSVRLSTTPWVRAMLSRIRYTQVFSDDRPLEPPEPAQHGEPRFLDDLVRGRLRAHVGPRDPGHRGVPGGPFAQGGGNP